MFKVGISVKSNLNKMKQDIQQQEKNNLKSQKTNTSTTKDKQKDVGDYIDFEEIKTNK